MDSQFLVGSGFGENQVGQAMKSGTTATESASVRESVGTRQSHKGDAVEGFLEGLAYDRLSFELPLTMFNYVGQGALGMGYGVGLGTKLGRPDRPAVSLLHRDHA